jgi:hypothetical protein
VHAVHAFRINSRYTSTSHQNEPRIQVEWQKQDEAQATKGKAIVPLDFHHYLKRGVSISYPSRLIKGCNPISTKRKVQRQFTQTRIFPVLYPQPPKTKMEKKSPKSQKKYTPPVVVYSLKTKTKKQTKVFPCRFAVYVAPFRPICPPSCLFCTIHAQGN